MAKLDEDPIMNFGLGAACVGLAVQVAAVTAYIPLAIIGPDPSRATLLMWVMPAWLVGATLVSTLLIRLAFRKWIIR